MMDKSILAMTTNNMRQRMETHSVPSSLARLTVPTEALEMLSCETDERREAYRAICFSTLVFCYAHYVFTSTYPTIDDVASFLEAHAAALIAADGRKGALQLAKNVLIDSHSVDALGERDFPHSCFRRSEGVRKRLLSRWCFGCYKSATNRARVCSGRRTPSQTPGQKTADTASTASLFESMFTCV